MCQMRLILSCDGLSDQIRLLMRFFLIYGNILNLQKYLLVEKWKGMISFLKQKHILYVNSEVYCKI